MVSIFDQKTFSECNSGSELVLEFLKLFNYNEEEKLKTFVNEWKQVVSSELIESSILMTTSKKVKTKDFKRKLHKN